MTKILEIGPDCLFASSGVMEILARKEAALAEKDDQAAYERGWNAAIEAAARRCEQQLKRGRLQAKVFAGVVRGLELVGRKSCWHDKQE